VGHVCVLFSHDGGSWEPTMKESTERETRVVVPAPKISNCCVWDLACVGPCVSLLCVGVPLPRLPRKFQGVHREQFQLREH
jgi:hypothetical protein